VTVIKIRIDFGDDRRIGHGRIQLLELIGEHGSITRAANATESDLRGYLLGVMN
jgi:molybdate transport system regulatory protein